MKYCFNRGNLIAIVSGISNVPDIFALNINVEDAILTSPVNEHDYCKGTQHPKSKQTLSEIVLLAPLSNFLL